MYSNSGLADRMGDDSEIQSKGFDRIDLDNGYFNDSLYVPNLEANMLSVYQMKHTRESKRVTFTPYVVEIEEISSNKVVALGYADHQARMYKFSKFLPNSRGKVLIYHANETSNIWHEIFGHMNYKYLK